MLRGGCVIDLDVLTDAHIVACIKYLEAGLLPVLEKLETTVRECVREFGAVNPDLEIQLCAMICANP